MIIRILGAHNVASATTGFTCVLIDGIITVDAGTLVSTLTFKEQRKINTLLLSHPHYDHMRDIPAFGMSKSMMRSSFTVYGAEPVREALFTYLVNDKLYIDFTKKPEKKPIMTFRLIEPGKKETVAGYEVLPVNMKHSVPCTGFQITSPSGKKVFVTSDTGPELAEAWKQISPDILITEVTVPNKADEFAHKAGHLTPKLLQKELESFKSIHNYLPRVVLMHLSPFLEEKIKEQLHDVEKALKIKITVSHEGMKIRV